MRRYSSEWLWCDNFKQVDSPHTIWLLNSTDALVSCWGLDPSLIHVSAGPTTCLLAGPTSSQLEETSARARPPAAAHSSPFPNLSLLRRPSANVHLLRRPSATHSKWRQYGPVLLTRCPDCPRPDPLKRLVTKTDDNGNLGREFVKCLSKPMAGRDGKVRSQFLARSFAVFCSDFSIFCFFSSNLGFRVHVVLFRS